MIYKKTAICLVITLLACSTGCQSNNQQAAVSAEPTGQVTQESQTIIESTTAKQEETSSSEINYEDLSIEELQELSNKGDDEAQFQLGRVYARGEKIEQDYQKAFEWYTKAAEQNHAYAQNNLGNMYFYGRGVEQDSQKAIEWYLKAAEQGNEEAKELLENIKQKELLLFESTTQEITSNTNSDNSIIKEGTYKVGKDIPAGEYIVTPDEGRTCYYEVSADSSGHSIITNENVDGQDYITVEDGQYFKIKRGTAKLAE